MKIMVTSFKRSHACMLHGVPSTLQQATTNPLETPGHSQASLGQSLWGHCSFLLGPGAQGSVCALQESISQPCVSSGSFMVGLMVTSSKRRNLGGSLPYPSLLHPESLSQWQSTADPYLHSRLSNTVLSQSVASLGPGAHKVCLSPLSISGGNGV